MQNYFKRFRDLLHVGHDSVPEEEVITGIIEGAGFSGAKLWILILAIFVACLGLNTNSTAVIIGAMLISPLMGPIIGMGLGVGINDFDLIKRCVHNYLIATLFSVCTATLYWLFTPIAQAESELLARTSPSFYDILIALCGGLAGIIALSDKSQRSGNVIPGVAIATALMPPLCTVGFGIATANITYALGALFLYLINTIFIALATYIGVAFIVKFKKKEYPDKSIEKRIRRIIILIILVTIIPALWLTFGMVRESIFEQRIDKFVKTEVQFPGSQIISKTINYDTKSLSIMLIGEEIDSLQINKMKENLRYYSLDDLNLQIIQNNNEIDEDAISLILQGNLSQQNQQLITQHNQNIKLEEQLSPYVETENYAHSIQKELPTLFPQIENISMAKGVKVIKTDTATKDSSITLIVIESSTPILTNDKDKIQNWLMQRTNRSNLSIIYQNK